MAATSGAADAGACMGAGDGICVGTACGSGTAELVFASANAAISVWAGAPMATAGGGEGEMRFGTMELLELLADTIVDDASIMSAGAPNDAAEWR